MYRIGITMLPEQRATSYANDPALGTIIVFCATATKVELGGEQPSRLLLDAGGHLVGLDIAPDSPHRLVVMLGPHESVANTEDARVVVENGGKKVTLHGGVAKRVTPGANPYVF